MSITYDVVFTEHSYDTIYYLLKHDDLEHYSIKNATITQTINKADTFTFELYPDNENYTKVKRFRSQLVRIYCYNSYRPSDDKLMWVGQISSISVDMNLKMSVTCKGALSFLDDTVAPAQIYDIESPKTFFNNVINNHNDQLEIYGSGTAQVNLEKNIQMKTIASGDFIGTNTQYSTNYEQSSLDAIMDNIIDNYGGYLHITYATSSSSSSTSDDGDIEVEFEEEQIYLNYLQKPTTPMNQPLVFGDNMIDFSYTEEQAQYSYMVVMGAVKKEYESEAENRLVLKRGCVSIPYQQIETPETCGVRVSQKLFETDNVNTLYSQWQSYKKNELTNENKLTATAKVYDKGVTDTTYPRYFVGNLVQITSTPHNFKKNLQITGLKYSLDNPMVKELTFGNVENTFMSKYLEGLYTKSKTKANKELASSGLMQNVIKQIGKSTSSS